MAALGFLFIKLARAVHAMHDEENGEFSFAEQGDPDDAPLPIRDVRADDNHRQ